MKRTLLTALISLNTFAAEAPVPSAEVLSAQVESEANTCCLPPQKPCTREQAFCVAKVADAAARSGERALRDFIGALAESARPAIQSACAGKEAVALWACALEHTRAAPMLEKRQAFAERSFQEFLAWGATSQKAQDLCQAAVNSFKEHPPQIVDAVERHMDAKKRMPECPPPLQVASSWDAIAALDEANLQRRLTPPKPTLSPLPVARRTARPWKKVLLSPSVAPKVAVVPSPAPSPSPLALSSPAKQRPRIVTIDQTDDTDRQLRAWQARQARHFEFARDSMEKLERILAKGKGVKQSDGTVLFGDDTRARRVSADAPGAGFSRAAYLVDRWLELDVAPAVVPAPSGYWVVQLPGVSRPEGKDSPSDRLRVLDYLVGHPDRGAAGESWGVVGRDRQSVVLSVQAGFQEFSAMPVQDVAKIIAGDVRLSARYAQATDELLLESVKELLSADELAWLKKRLEQLRDRVKILSNFTRSS